MDTHKVGSKDPLGYYSQRSLALHIVSIISPEKALHIEEITRRTWHMKHNSIFLVGLGDPLGYSYGSLTNRQYIQKGNT
jgi:hypothetical protein